MRWQLVSKARTLVRRRSGSVAVQIGLMMTVIIGTLSLGTEVPYVLHKHRQLQTTADMAAVSAAATRIDSKNVAAINEARAVTASAGLVHGSGGVSVQLTRPPVSGRYAGVAEAFEVVISQPQTVDLAKVLGVSKFDLRVRATALQTSVGPYCMLALDNGARSAIDVKADAVLPNSACGIASNSASDTALVLGSNSTVKGSTSVRGQVSLAMTSGLHGSPNTENGPYVNDPYSGVPDAPTLPCTSQSGVVAQCVSKAPTPAPYCADDAPPAACGTVNLTPGHFCGGWTFAADTTVNLAPGNYVIDTQLTLGDRVKLTGNGVTLFINGDYEMIMGNNVSISLKAPTSGTYAGLAIFSRRTAKASTTHKFGKTASLDITGALYFPNQIVELKTNVSKSTGCSQVIARVVRVENSVMLADHCTGTGTRTIVGAASKLVE